MNDITEEQRRQIMDEVARFTTIPPLAPDEFTASQFAERQRPKISIKLARLWLNEGVEEGRLKRRWVLHAQRRQYGYSLVEGAADARDVVAEDRPD